MHRLRTTTAPLAARILSPCLAVCLAFCLAPCLVLAAPAARASAATEESVSLTAGGTYPISLDIEDGASVTYTSSDTSVATVSDDGTITAVGAGTADVIATIETTATDSETDGDSTETGDGDSTDTGDGDSTETDTETDSGSDSTETDTDTATGAETTTDTHTVHVTVTRRTPTITATNISQKFTLDKVAITWSTTSDGEATFTSADTSVASVGAKGNVTAKGIGTTTITIAVSETSACYAVSTTISVTFTSTAAQAKKPSIARSGSVITLTWAASSGATQYAVFQKKGSGSWKRLGYVDSSSRTYKVTGIEKGVVYAFRLRAFGLSLVDHVACGTAARHIRMSATSSLTVANMAVGIELAWTRVEKATGYRVYRNGTLIATLNAAARVFYRDTSVSTAKKYRYGVFAWHGATASEGDSRYAAITRVRLVNGMGVRTARLQTKASKQRVRQAQKRLASARKKGNETAIERAKLALARARSNVRHTKNVRISWKKATGAVRWQVQCSTNPLFLTARTKTLTGAGRRSWVFKGLNGEKTWYVRMRVCARADGRASWSAWKLSGNVAASKSAHAAYVGRGGKAVELRALAKQGIGKWDTVQGSCSDGTFGYYVLNRRSSGNCRILKVRLSTMRRVKLSGILSIGHGNGIAYDSSAKRLVVHVAGKKFAFVSPTTLRVTKTMKVELGTGTWGVSTKTKRHFSAVAYCKSRRQYALMSSSPGSVLVTDANLSPVKYLNLTRFGHGTLQSIACTDSYILIAWSGPNYIYVYDWSGKYVTRIKIGTSGELESVIVTGKRIFASVYNSRAGRRNYVLRLSF